MKKLIGILVAALLVMQSFAVLAYDDVYVDGNLQMSESGKNNYQDTLTVTNAKVVDYQATMDLKNVRDKYVEYYDAAVESATNLGLEVANVEKGKVDAAITVTVQFPAGLTPSNAFLTATGMSNFIGYDSQNGIFVEDTERLVTDNEDGSKTVVIAIKVKDGLSAKELKDNLDTYLSDLALECKSVVGSDYTSYTVTGSVEGDITISTDIYSRSIRILSREAGTDKDAVSATVTFRSKSNPAPGPSTHSSGWGTSATATPKPTTEPGATAEPGSTAAPGASAQPGTEPGTVTPGEVPFTDVAPSDWYAEAVQYVYEHGLMNGTSADSFEPNLPVNRAMFATIVYRIEGSPATSPNMTFTDVPADEYYANAVAWCEANGIVTGYSDTEYAPEGQILREQMAAIMYRYANFKGIDTTASVAQYTDSNLIDDYAVPGVSFCTEAGLMNGVGDGAFDPQADATRGEVATVVMRLYNSVVTE